MTELFGCEADMKRRRPAAEKKSWKEFEKRVGNNAKKRSECYRRLLPQDDLNHTNHWTPETSFPLKITTKSI